MHYREIVFLIFCWEQSALLGVSFERFYWIFAFFGVIWGHENPSLHFCLSVREVRVWNVRYRTVALPYCYIIGCDIARPFELEPRHLSTQRVRNWVRGINASLWQMQLQRIFNYISGDVIWRSTLCRSAQSWANLVSCYAVLLSLGWKFKTKVNWEGGRAKCNSLDMNDASSRYV